MLALPFLVLCLAGAGLSLAPRARTVQKEVRITSTVTFSARPGPSPPHTYKTNPAPSVSTALPSSLPTDPLADDRAFLIGVVPWQENPDLKTAQQMLERLVQYQDVYRTMTSEGPKGGEDNAPSAKLPANIVEEIHKMNTILDHGGILNGGNVRILDALDVIFDNVCADTGKTGQIPGTVKDTVNLVLRGISSELQPCVPDTSSPPGRT
ncbi:hypothetical protein PG994_014537 [Apiospora phragmitis]|uniref:Uncharacterized protein n=1 Tax=Apiospora phragmitis TaxID=2905665 RepID=A0ABR1T4K7_9PEZI